MIVDPTATMTGNNEIAKMLYKLKDLIPGIPADKKMSKLEIMQNVIDYITDLELALESTTSDSTSQGSKQAAARQTLTPINYGHHQLINY